MISGKVLRKNIDKECFVVCGEGRIQVTGTLKEDKDLGWYLEEYPGEVVNNVYLDWAGVILFRAPSSEIPDIVVPKQKILV